MVSLDNRSAVWDSIAEFLTELATPGPMQEIAMQHSRGSIAPYDLIQRDFRELDSAETLRTTWDTERLVLMQSVQGHAHEGHGRFRGSRYPDTSMDDISRALRLDPTWVRAERQTLIDEICAYVDRVIAGDDDAPLSNEDGVGFIGSSMFRDLKVSGGDVLKGLYMGGLRDTPEYRFAMETEYGITIGGGKCYLVDTKVMDDMRLNGDVLAHSAHEEMIDFYRDRGLIYADAGPDTGDLEYLYVRHRRGEGASDDAAVVVAGLLYGVGVAVGVFLADAIDTFEKHVPVFSDQDSGLARGIGERYGDLGVTDEQVKHLAYLAAVPARSSIPVPDSSLRHLLLVDRKHDLTAIESHLRFVQNKPCPVIHLGHENVVNRDFYDYVRARVESMPEPIAKPRRRK